MVSYMMGAINLLKHIRNTGKVRPYLQRFSVNDCLYQIYTE